jgi:hypothetical protein
MHFGWWLEGCKILFKGWLSPVKKLNEEAHKTRNKKRTISHSIKNKKKWQASTYKQTHIE